MLLKNKLLISFTKKFLMITLL